MAFIDCYCHSETLGQAVAMYVILPQNTTKQVGMEGKAGTGKHPTLYLLHGGSDDHTIWMRRTSIERYVASLGLAVVMPAVRLSSYVNMVHGERFWDFVSDELLTLTREFFPLSDRREDTFTAGLSMGGYGAFRLGLKCPEKFAAAASLSGGLWRDKEKISATRPAMRKVMENAFGSLDNFPGSEHDLVQAAKDLKASGKPMPKLYMCCGTEDFLYEGNVKYRDFLREEQIECTYEEEPGNHEWGYWDTKIQNILRWLPLACNEE